MKIVALAGGTGAAKLLRGLVRVIDPVDLTIIGNTGDDCELWGLSISPDLDTVTYTLSGRIDENKGWGVRDETFQCRDTIAHLGEETWFALGDRDIALHLYRTQRLRQGISLTTITDDVRQKLGIASRIVPMTDAPVRTRVLTPEGWLSFQEFFVRARCQPRVIDVAYEGDQAARPAAGVSEAIAAADAVFICPSNPVSSIGPILAVPGIEEALVSTAARIVGVSPIIGTTPVSGPAGKMMAAKGYEVSSLGVARAYHRWLDVLLLDESDASMADDVNRLGIRPRMASILMGDRAREIALAGAMLGALT